MCIAGGMSKASCSRCFHSPTWLDSTVSLWMCVDGGHTVICSGRSNSFGGLPSSNALIRGMVDENDGDVSNRMTTEWRTVRRAASQRRRYRHARASNSDASPQRHPTHADETWDHEDIEHSLRGLRYRHSTDNTSDRFPMDTVCCQEECARIGHASSEPRDAEKHMDTGYGSAWD